MHIKRVAVEAVFDFKTIKNIHDSQKPYNILHSNGKLGKNKNSYNVIL